MVHRVIKNGRQTCEMFNNLSHVTCSNEMSRLSVNLISRNIKLHKHATMISDGFDFLSPKYILISFLSIGNAYFLFIII